jgi:hypothetical protein
MKGGTGGKMKKAHLAYLGTLTSALGCSLFLIAGDKGMAALLGVFVFLFGYQAFKCTINPKLEAGKMANDEALQIAHKIVEAHVNSWGRIPDAKYLIEAIAASLHGIDRLREIEAAAIAWRRSLEDDGWTKETIEEGVGRPGMAELMSLIPADIADKRTAIGEK